MFWEDTISNEEKIANDNKNRPFSGIDTIKIKEKLTNYPPSPTPQKSKIWLFILLLIIPLFVFASLIAVKAGKSKLDFLKLFGSGKYLVLFQNNAELRPSGGFIGSFAIVEFSDYKIKNINFNTNIYKLDKAFSYENNIPPPEPLKKITEKWALRDANFAVSYPEAAQKVQWFYEKESGEKIDGVIAINAMVIHDLLKLTGPIELQNYNLKLNEDNFFTELTRIIEKDYYEDPVNKQINEPKTILKDLMTPILTQAYQLDKLKLAKLIYNNLNEKQVLFYANNSVVEQAILGENWGGQVKDSTGDYLYINNANVNGGKSSLSVKEKIDYKVEDQNDLLIGNLTLTRSHAGSFVWPDGINNNWTRILVPDGAILKKAQLNGRDIINEVETGTEAGKTYFGLWLNTVPNTSNILNLTYILPIPTKNYQLLVQKQPGNTGDEMTVDYGPRILFDGILNEDKTIRL